MVEIKNAPGLSAEFALAIESLRQASVRPELELKEIPAPSDLAKHAVAFSCETSSEFQSELTDRAVGRMVVLWDTKPQEAWSSRFRVIIYSKAPMDNDIMQEDVSSKELTWIWLKDALESNGAHYGAEAGTATRIASQGFGSLDSHKEHHEVELRASWSPTDTNLGNHMVAWQALVCAMGGHPLQNENIANIR